MQQLLQLAQEAEPIRPDKVDALRQKIESGTYRVDLESVANGMLEDL
jgi:flagellar biosynthesis anti-sigma factor FlgM